PSEPRDLVLFGSPRSVCHAYRRPKTRDRRAAVSVHKALRSAHRTADQSSRKREFFSKAANGSSGAKDRKDPCISLALYSGKNCSSDLRRFSALFVEPSRLEDLRSARRVQTSAQLGTAEEALIKPFA